MIDRVFQELDSNLDNPEWLSKAIIYLSGQLFTHNTEMAKAEIEEKKSAIEMIDLAIAEGGKLSVAEAEKRAVVATQNKYGIMKVQGDAIVETINAIKARLKVLEWERQVSNL